MKVDTTIYHPFALILEMSDDVAGYQMMWMLGCIYARSNLLQFLLIHHLSSSILYSGWSETSNYNAGPKIAG